MAITIRNRTTEELIRKIGRRTGEGPSALVARLVEREASGGHDQRVSEDEVRRRVAAFEELAKQFPPPDPKPTWEEIERDRDALYDYLDTEYGEAEKPGKPR